jgi:hypothetical protein
LCGWRSWGKIRWCKGGWSSQTREGKGHRTSRPRRAQRM